MPVFIMYKALLPCIWKVHINVLEKSTIMMKGGSQRKDELADLNI